MLQAHEYFHGRTDGKPQIRIGDRVFAPFENCVLLPGNPTAHRYELNWLPPSSIHLDLMRREMQPRARLEFITDKVLAEEVAKEAIRYGDAYLVREVHYKFWSKQISKLVCFEGIPNRLPSFGEQTFESADLISPIKWTTIFWFEAVIK